MNDIRRQAQKRRQDIGIELGDPVPAEAVIAACLAAAGLERAFTAPDDALLAGAMAVLNLPLGVIIHDASRSGPEQQFDAAHEMAHFWLHGDLCRCLPEDLNPDDTEETPGSARSKVDGYSPKQRRETRPMSLPPSCFCPGPLARTLFLEERMSSEAIADALGLPSSVVQYQFAESLLLPEMERRAKPKNFQKKRRRLPPWS